MPQALPDVYSPMPDDKSAKDPLDQLPDDLVNALAEKTEQLLFAIAALTGGQKVLATHHEQVELDKKPTRTRVTVLTDKALLEVEVDAKKKNWMAGNQLVDDDISVKAWRLQDIQSVTPGVVVLHQPDGQFVHTTFERVDVRLAGAEDPLRIPATEGTETVARSQTLRNALWDTWLSTTR
jgi:hypothetical protein